MRSIRIWLALRLSAAWARVFNVSAAGSDSLRDLATYADRESDEWLAHADDLEEGRR